MLTCYTFLKAFSKMKEFKPSFMAKYFIHRFWRLTPPYMLVIMISSNLTKYLGDGPSYLKDGFDPTCKTEWWKNILYINNFWPAEKLVTIDI
jgi:peptidoglycan/LPS O-acetylase OafA/YrhL